MNRDRMCVTCFSIVSLTHSAEQVDAKVILNFYRHIICKATSPGEYLQLQMPRNVLPYNVSIATTRSTFILWSVPSPL